jgi:integrase
MIMTKRLGYGEGSMDERGANQWRLRYRADGKRHTVTFHGTKTEARAELRRLARSVDTGEHVAPDRLTLAAWIDQWLDLIERNPAGARRRKRGLVNPRSLERYTELLRGRVVPILGERPLQKIKPTEIDKLYGKLENDPKHPLAPRTVHHIHYILGACLEAAVRKKLLASNPVAGADAPVPGKSDHGIALDRDQLRRLVEGFRNAPLFEIVAVAAATGMRRNEILALRWSDLDKAKKTIRIARSLERTTKFGLAFKEPKSSRSNRTIVIEDELLRILCGLHDKHLRIKAGVPDGVPVNLSLVKLPEDALMFPSPGSIPGASFSFTQPRDPGNVTEKFIRRATKLGFKGMRFHDLRGTAITIALAAGRPVHEVAARCGHDPAVMLRVYAKPSEEADAKTAQVMGDVLKGVL